MSNYTRNHYVPQWYQKKFLTEVGRERKFYYLDLHPETLTIANGRTYQRDQLLRWGPPKCFCEDDLYSTRFSNWKFTEIEEKFFGILDSNGKSAIEYFDNFSHPNADPNAFQAFLPYISVQRLRTPKGLKYLSEVTKSKNKNELLFTMQKLHRMYCALWTECVWSIVDASNSNTKFILSDNPITFYNQGCFPQSRQCRGVSDPGTWLNGTHTIFPLSLNKALILTNLSWVRNPYGNPLKERPNPELFRGALFNFTQIQTGRMLSDQDVIAINYLIKTRASRYIAAAEKEWLYPEEKLKIKYRWDEFGLSYLLMPDPRSVIFSSEMIIGYGKGKADAFDEYGRKPWQADYKEKGRHDKEWYTFHAFKGEYARLFGSKRRGLGYDFCDVDRSVDDDRFHAYHLSLEAKYKALIGKSRA